MAPLESGFATFQSPSEQREECSHRTHIDERKHESGLFRLQTSPQMKWNLSAIQLNVTRNPVARGTVTEHLPCLSESVFVDVVMCASRLSSPVACNVSVCTTPLASRPKSSSTSRPAAASLFGMMTDVCPPAVSRVRLCIDSRILQLYREVGLQQRSAAERARKLEPIRDRLQDIVRAKCPNR